MPFTVCRMLVIAVSAALSVGCATTRNDAPTSADALTVATVRHTAGPQPQAVWIAREALPRDASRSDGERALLLEVALQDGAVRSVESAPLELANLVVRIDARTRRDTVIAVQNGTSAALSFDLFVSPDGERFREIPACPVLPHAEAFERWPERVAWIAIGNVRTAADARRCN